MCSQETDIFHDIAWVKGEETYNALYGCMPSMGSVGYTMEGCWRFFQNSGALSSPRTGEAPLWN